MPPPAATVTASAALPRLPIPRAALSALDQCRRPQPSATTASLSTTIIRAALANGHSLPSPSLQYVTRRLLIGVSASAGASRLNYSIALVGLTRQLAASGTHCAIDELLAAVRKIYGPDGSFELGYSGAERERALGTLAATAALVAGMESASLSAATVREFVCLLRGTCDGDCARWRLGCAAVHVVKKLLAVVKANERDSAVKPMWTWCENRREKEDGLQMAFMLYDAGLVHQKAFRKLYPTLADGFETALLDTFESGFSSLGEHAVVTDQGGIDGVTYHVPYGWSMAVRYVLTPEGADHLGNVSHFWRSVVLEKLVRGSRSSEKKLLAIELIPLVLAEVNDVKTFETVFERSVASMIAVILGTRRGKNSSVVLRKNRTSDDVMKCMIQSARTLGERMVAQIREKDVNLEGSQPLLRAFLLWAVKGGILNQLLPSPHLSEALAAFQPHDVKTLFSGAVKEFAQPHNEEYDAREFRDVCNSSTRMNILRFIFAIAEEHDFLAKDAIRVVTMYCIFKREGAVSTGKDQHLMKFDALQKCSLPATWCGILPDLNPCLSANVAALGFRRLVDFLTRHRRGDHVDVLPTFCMELISSIVSSKKTCLKPRKCLSVKAHAEGDQNFLVLQKTATDTVAKLSRASGNDKTDSLARSLRIIAIFLYLFTHNPRAEEVSENMEADEESDEVLTLFRKVGKYADYIFDGVPKKARTVGLANPQDQAAEEDETPPEPVEYIAQLITDLCGRDAASFRQIATMAIEALGSALDDRVLAVLFDAMDSYLSGESIKVPMGAPNDDTSEDDDDHRDGNEDDGDARNMKHVSDEESEVADDVKVTKLVETEKEATISAIPKRKEKGDSNDSYDSMNDDSEEEIDVDMDVDKEDPKVLAEFDNRLSAHLRLLKQEKKTAIRRKLRADFRYVQVSRILDVVEAIARVLRMRLERSQIQDSRLPVVFLDLHVRLYEFVLGEGAKNFRFLKQVCDIVSKQVLVHSSVFTGKVWDSVTVSEITGRFLEVLRCCRTDRKVSDAEARVISKSAGCLTGVAVSLSNGDYLTYLPTYQEILVNMLKPGSHFWTPLMFNSFLQKAPIRSLIVLSSIILEALVSSEMTKNIRQTASEMFLALSLVACKVEGEGDGDVVKFWDNASICLLKHCAGSSARKWNSEGYANMVQIASNGLRRGCFGDADCLISQLETGVEAAALSHRERTRLLKLLKKPEKLANNKRPIADVVTGRSQTVRIATPTSVTAVRKEKKRKTTGPK